MTAGTDLLTLWRAGAPTTLLSDEALASRLRAFFAARLEPRECYEKQLLDSVLRGDRQSANATFARAGMLWSGFHPPPDLAMSWMLLAALCEHEPAMLALARGLLAHADQLAERGRRRVPDEHGRRALMREAALAERLSISWWREIKSPLAVRADRWRSKLAPPTFPTSEAETPVSEHRPQMELHPAAPTVQVVEKVGSPETEGATYEVLTKSLPLPGRHVDPEILRTALSLVPAYGGG